MNRIWQIQTRAFTFSWLLTIELWWTWLLFFSYFDLNVIWSPHFHCFMNQLTMNARHQSTSWNICPRPKNGAPFLVPFCDRKFEEVSLHFLFPIIWWTDLYCSECISILYQMAEYYFEQGKTAGPFQVYCKRRRGYFKPFESMADGSRTRWLLFAWHRHVSFGVHKNLFVSW